MITPRDSFKLGEEAAADGEKKEENEVEQERKVMMMKCNDSGGRIRRGIDR